MTTIEERERCAEQQRHRRMTQRRCGNCYDPAEEMMEWLGQAIPICSSCRGRLAFLPTAPICAFGEVSPLFARPPEQVIPPTVPEVAGEPDDAEGGEDEESMVHRVISRVLGR